MKNAGAQVFSLGIAGPLDPRRNAMRRQCRRDEAEVIKTLLPLAELDAAARARAWHRAHRLTIGIRSAQAGQGAIGQLLNEFPLSTQEGVVLMCLAEALLRVPDSRTADWLIRDKLESGDWSSRQRGSDSLFVNATAWGLLLTGKVVRFNDRDLEEKASLLKKAIARLGEPVVRTAVTQAMRIMGGQFVMGSTIEAAIRRAQEQERRGYVYSYDMLGEGARTLADADRYCAAYMRATEAIGKVAGGRGPVAGPGISVKLSALHPRYQFAQRQRALGELAPRLKRLALAAKAWDIGFTIDAEEADRLDLSLDLIETLFADPQLNGWEGFGVAVQAYQKRAVQLIDWLADLAGRAGRRMMVRLVKGAYWDAEIKLSQEQGQAGYPVFTRKPATDLSYQACARRLLERRELLYPQFATHNAYSAAVVLELAGNSAGFEFQRLHGMGEELHDQLLGAVGVPCRIYAPVGEHEDLLAYLVRRLLENGANTSFVNNVVNESAPIESLLADPVEKAGGWRRPANPRIPLPRDIYGPERINSQGFDLADALHLRNLQSSLNRWAAGNVRPDDGAQSDWTLVRNPANRRERLGRVAPASETELDGMLAAAVAACDSWSALPAKERGGCLRRLADALEANRDALLALCIKEAGKTLPDSLAEVREAVDFCRYYANQGERLFARQAVRPLGTMLCISPWNFPLAIFLGQVTAALAAGNAVIAKPAEQTCLIAGLAHRLMAECGFPDGLVQLACCSGETAGRLLVPDARIKGVLVTAATETGASIARSLARRPGWPTPLIAETGGQNAMIVDSTALSEQVVDDVLVSGFLSAGQRCSALRVLFVQEDVADAIIAMIVGAMRELRVGNPARLDVDLGPVIDAAALARLEEHAACMEKAGALLHRCKLSDDCAKGFFFAPRLYEIPSIDALKGEVFGPVVHLIRYQAAQLDLVVDAVNATGYGLTLGVHSRIATAAERIGRRAKVGNVYVNRNMVGAVVGAQPFGGRGLSGTGPKAGGPHYLARLVAPKDAFGRLAPAAKPPPGSAARPRFGPEAKPGRLSAAAEDMLALLAAHQRSWAATPVAQRAGALRRFAGLAAVEAPGLGILDDPGLSEILRRCGQLAAAAERMLAEPEQMPGPTGELNLLHRESRGVLLCLHAAPFAAVDWATQIAAALAAGNSALATVGEANQALACALVRWFREAGAPEDALGLLLAPKAAELDALHWDRRIAGVAINHCCRQAQASNQVLAALERGMIPLIAEPFSPLYLHRFVTEKTISVNTAAAGGNASLMALGDAD